MDNSDGQVRIEVISNFDEVAKSADKCEKQINNFDVSGLEKSFDNLDKTLNTLSSQFADFSKPVRQNENALLELENTIKSQYAEIEKLQNGYNDLTAELNKLKKPVDENSKNFDNLGKSYNTALVAQEKLFAALHVDKSFHDTSGAVNEAVQRMKELAFQGDTTSKEYKNLTQFVNEANKKIKESSKAVEKATGGTQGLTVAGIELSTVIKGISFVAVARELYQFGQQALQTAGEFEQLETSFKIMAGGAAQGEKLTKSLIDLANKTPMTTEGLARATQTLLSFGESSDNIIKDLQLLGDISGGQEQRFQSLALAFAQVGSTGRLTGQNLLQMVNQGFNPLQVISEKTGKSMATLKKEMGEGKVSFDMVKQAMIDATSEGGRFYGLMNEQSGTLNGLLSTNADTWQQVSKNIGDIFLPTAKEAIKTWIGIGQAIQKATSRLAEWVQKQREAGNAKDIKALETSLKYQQEQLKKATGEDKKLWEQRIAQTKKYLEYQRGVFAKPTESSAKVSSGFGGSGGDAISSSAKRVKEVKDAFEQAQAEAQKAEKAFKLALYQSGGNVTPAVEQARLKMVNTKKVVEDVQKAFENLTAKAKTPFEQLNYNIEQSRQKIISLASQPIVNIEAIRQVQTEYQGFLAQQEQINSYLQPVKGAYQGLNDKVGELTQKLRDLAAENKIGSADWNMYKTQLQSAQAELDNVNKSLEDNGIKINDVSKQISSSISSGLVNALRNGGNAFDAFSSLATTALQKVLDKLIELSFVTPVLNAFTGGTGGTLFSGIAKIFGSANGNVFQNGNVIPFAKGGVVNQPTIFPMANGGTGLMGEAGAEAVMPLRRMSNGRLGVEAENSNGKAVQVNIYNQSGANVETRKRDDGSMDIFIRKVNEALSSERTSSGFRSAYAREDRKGVQAV